MAFSESAGGQVIGQADGPDMGHAAIAASVLRRQDKLQRVLVPWSPTNCVRASRTVRK
jgi:hypothetical protein